MRRLLTGSLLSFLAATAVAAQDISKVIASAPRIEALASSVTVRLRGLSAVDENIAWASGREGTVIRTVDAGKTWSVFKVPGAEKLDFRDVEAFSADEAVVLSIGPGEDSRVYRTTDGGKTWTPALQNADPKVFLDCFDFEGSRGWLLGDPVDGRFQIYETADRGASWTLQVAGPEAVSGESAFAASGTCIARVGPFLVVASGGGQSRIHYRQDGDAGWTKIASGIGSGSEASGVFSISALPPKADLLVVGGDFKKEAAPGGAGYFQASMRFISTDDGGPEGKFNATRLGFLPAAMREGRATASPRGYRSGVSCADGASRRYCIATGPTGSDAWGGASWSVVGDVGYDSVDVAGNVFWFSGDAGRLGRLVLPE